MGLRDLLKKKDHEEGGEAVDAEATGGQGAPAVIFQRSDTIPPERAFPPPAPEDDNYLTAGDGGSGKSRRSLDVFHGSRSRSASVSSRASSSSRKEGRDSRRLSQRLHLGRSPASSENVPEDLPAIAAPADGGGDEGIESQWEKRATMLANQNERHRSRPSTPVQGMAHMSLDGGAGNPVSSKAIDADIQEAIRLHEAGQLERSTAMFGRLADPNGANNPLSQVLYGLALRHGWGCSPDPAGAVTYLTKAASNAAVVESLALQAGIKKGGAAKGELVLAIFELANCFRNGWGIPRDPIAAKHYYETAANLGDTDAMNEIAWCYLEGFGCKKDKFAAARYYRLAEKNGNKTLGNSWIWKEKYDPPEAGSGKR